MQGRDGDFPDRKVPVLLLAEPDPLMRWSLATYLGRWFRVLQTDSPAAADHILDEQHVDAMVTSDHAPPRVTDALTAHAHRANPDVIVVRTVSMPAQAAPAPGEAMLLEKPFDLASLAGMLGVRVTEEDDGG